MGRVAPDLFWPPKLSRRDLTSEVKQERTRAVLTHDSNPRPKTTRKPETGWLGASAQSGPVWAICPWNPVFSTKIAWSSGYDDIMIDDSCPSPHAAELLRWNCADPPVGCPAFIFYSRISYRFKTCLERQADPYRPYMTWLNLPIHPLISESGYAVWCSMARFRHTCICVFTRMFICLIQIILYVRKYTYVYINMRVCNVMGRDGM